MQPSAPLRTVLLAGFATYRANWTTILAVSAAILVPTAALEGIIVAALDGQLGSDVLPLALLAAAAVAASGLGYFLLKGVIAQIVVAERTGSPRPSIAAIARSLPVLTLLAVDVILTLGITVGLELLILPGVVFGTWFALAPIVVETEHRGVIDSLRRSGDLVKGRFWSVFLLLFTTLALVGALHWPLDSLVEEVFAGLSEALQEGIGYLLAGVLIKPVGAVITVELTLELAARHEAPPHERLCDSLDEKR